MAEACSCCFEQITLQHMAFHEIHKIVMPEFQTLNSPGHSKNSDNTLLASDS